jgi:hypothetical protein
MRKVQWLPLLLVSFVAATAVCSAGDAAVSPTAELPIRVPDWLRQEARDFADELPEVHVHAHMHEQQWEQSGGRTCIPPLNPVYFCRPRPHPGLGFALTSNGSVGGAWSSPYLGRTLVGRLLADHFYWLQCYTYGQASYGPFTSSDSLWYRLPGDGSYISDAWLDTGTNGPQPGVPAC